MAMACDFATFVRAVKTVGLPSDDELRTYSILELIQLAVWCWTLVGDPYAQTTGENYGF